MAFLDKLSKTVTEASQKTLAKTKELADTSRLNSLISEEEKKITNQYYQIGKLYVSIHRDSYEDDFSGMINAVTESEGKITKHRFKKSKVYSDVRNVEQKFLMAQRFVVLVEL